jgi:hypothetical protein
VIPARKGDPLFQGFIYIASNDYQIYGSELMLTKDAQIQMVDTVNLLQETVLINPDYALEKTNGYSNTLA